MLPLIGLGIGLAGAVGKAIGRGKANKQMDALLAQDPKYKKNPLSDQRLGLAQQLLKARMPGASAAERNIYGNQASTVANIGRNATDSSQALLLATGAQGQTNDAFQNLGMAESQDYQQRLGNLNQAQDVAINEDDKVFQDEQRRFGNKMQIRGAQNENRQNTWGDISNFGFAAANFGLQGGFDNLFGKKKQQQEMNPMQQQYPTSFSQLQGNRPINYGYVNSSYPKIG